MTQFDALKLKADYESGKYTIKELAEQYRISTGKAYYSLKENGCIFSRKWRKPVSEKFRAKISAKNKGRKLTEEHKRAISEHNSCNYNGLNGYGHTKNHCCGYILAYVPKHPHAHKDGYVMLHTVLMEQHIGRYLNADEVVHHINHDRSDNRIENLQLMTKHEHCLMHMKERHQKRRDALSIACL